MGVWAVVQQSFPSKPEWSTDQIPDLTGKVVIVTGGNTGIGKETVKVLLQHNAKVYLAARNEKKAIQAIRDLKNETGKEAYFLQLDLADLKVVKAAAEEFLSKENDLHILFNNGGVMTAPVPMITAQGYDLQFGTNVLGHFYFTQLLLPALLSGAKTSSDGTARVVNTASAAQEFINHIDFNTLKDGPARRKKLTHTLYAESKLATVIFTNELARRYGSQGIISTSMNPGNIVSELQRHLDIVGRALSHYLLYPTPYGALTQLYAGTSPEGKHLNGKYLVPFARVGKSPPAGEDTELGAELWRWMEAEVQNI
ncbi:hypothetical protein BDQ12DRAFT_739138 [Crucibulum laeve]|uniref:NAD(P)-binding protein n=1 Tax=Crucibulum laeve TaxID=68775 RepID=A0A5C3LIF6_9AGAR|nr:hypothetical protein BDQ12DRAFT_739138 [Crucibulum laeve]